MGGGPLLVAQNATIADWPTEAGGDFTVLRQGTNAWTCLPDDPATPTDDPYCVDDRWMQWLNAFVAGVDPEITTLGIGYMLQGGSSASNTDPSVVEPPAGEEWKVGPPHLMVISPDKLDPAAFATDPGEGGAWIMWEGTPYEHLMIPVNVADRRTSDRRQDSERHGRRPSAGCQNATIADWPTEAGGDFTVLRQGTNAWTCLPDDPATPTDDPYCVDDRWMQWLNAFVAGTDPGITTLGIGYMLQGGSSASNTDPSVVEPAAGEEWKIGPPHLMVISPDKLDPAAHATDPEEGGAWIMWEGTPYEHLMIPTEISTE